MNGIPSVSVITIFLNAERFLREAIESVFAQTYSNWELLLVDDGSTDASTKIALEYAREHAHRVRYLEHEMHQNRGMSASRNLGLVHAKGQYVAMLDSDDVWFAHKLEQQVAIFNAYPEASLVYGNRRYWHSWDGSAKDLDSISESGIEPNTLVRPPELLTLTYVLAKAVNPGSDVIFRREMALQIGGYENEFKGVFEDQVFLAKVFSKKSVFVSDECWTKYREHPDSCMYRWLKSEDIRSAYFSYLIWFEGYLSKEGMKDNNTWQSLQKKLWPYRHPFLYHLLKLLKCLTRRLMTGSFRHRLRNKLGLRTSVDFGM